MVQVQWLKVYTDIFDNEKMKKLLRNRDGDTYFRVWIQLLTLAAKSNQHGAILLGENIPMSKEDLAKVMHKTLNKLEKIIQDLHKLDMIIVEKDTICIKNWDMYQSAHVGVWTQPGEQHCRYRQGNFKRHKNTGIDLPEAFGKELGAEAGLPEAGKIK